MIESTDVVCPRLHSAIPWKTNGGQAALLGQGHHGQMLWDKPRDRRYDLDDAHEKVF